jgi:hypothetical protein
MGCDLILGRSDDGETLCARGRTPGLGPNQAVLVVWGRFRRANQTGTTSNPECKWEDRPETPGKTRRPRRRRPAAGGIVQSVVWRRVCHMRPVPREAVSQPGPRTDDTTADSFVLSWRLP